MKPETVIDKVLIGEVIAQLAHTHDDKDWDAFRSLLCPEVHIDLSHYLDAEPIDVDAHTAADSLAATLNGFHSTHHTTSDVVIDVDGPSATVRSHITAYFHFPRLEDDADHCVMRGTWDVKLLQLQGRWLVEKMVITRTTPWEGDPGLFALAYEKTQNRAQG